MSKSRLFSKKQEQQVIYGTGIKFKPEDPRHQHYQIEKISSFNSHNRMLKNPNELNAFSQKSWMIPKL